MIDPTWSDGAAYLGIPFSSTYARQRQRTTGHLPLLWSPTVFDLLRDGLPDDATINIGQHLPMHT